MRRFSLLQIIALLIWVFVVAAAATGELKLDVMGEIGAGAKNQAEVIAPDGKVVASVTPGTSIALPPGIYKLRLPLIGGTITRDDIAIAAGRTHTVLIENAAVLSVSVKDKDGHDPGFSVTVNQTDAPHNRLATFVSGEKLLFAPSMVDVKVDAPPQGYDWHAVTLIPGHRAALSLDEVQHAELTIQPMLSHLAIDKTSRVIVYRAGTQSQVAVSEPAPEHRIKLEPGNYDIFVENHSGKGKPYSTLNGVHLEPGATVSRKIPLD
ncbi:MAG TPA: hypothetical protein VKV03_17885 [Candidatus Binataceae bacterium]|nr:hypothetical protein [Candidatus Binataceae bacterium]